MTSERPHWWAIMSVGIALIALISAVSGSRHFQKNGPGEDGAPHRGRTSGERSSGPVDRVAPALQDAMPSGPSIAPTSSIAELPHTSPPVGTDPISAVAAPVLRPVTEPFSPGSYQGYFESPWVVSTTYPISGDGSLAATATWSQPIEMTLTVSCPLSDKSETGGSGISVTMTQPDTSCSVSLTEPFNTPGVVDYAIEVTS